MPLYDIKDAVTIMVTTDSIADEHGWFNCIRQVAPMCISTNTRLLAWAHTNRHQVPRRHLNLFGRFFTAHPFDQHTDRQTDTQTRRRQDTCVLCRLVGEGGVNNYQVDKLFLKKLLGKIKTSCL